MIDDFLSESSFDSTNFKFRDPWDVALFTCEAGGDERSPENSVKHRLDWRCRVRTLLQKRGPSHIEHGYEDLIREPDATLARVWSSIHPGGVLILHLNIKNPICTRDFELMFEAGAGGLQDGDSCSRQA